MRILLIEDDLNFRIALETLLTYEFPEASVRWHADEEEALAAIETFRPQVILFDLRRPGDRGFEFVKKVRRQWGNKPPVMMLAGRGGAYAKKAAEAGAAAVLIKPFHNGELIACLRGLAETALAATAG